MKIKKDIDKKIRPLIEHQNVLGNETVELQTCDDEPIKLFIVEFLKPCRNFPSRHLIPFVTLA